MSSYFTTASTQYYTIQKEAQLSATTDMPRRLTTALATIQKDPGLSLGVRTMMDREKEFSSPLTAMLAGIAVMPESRKRLNDALDEMWAKNRLPSPKSNGYPEVVIGAGLHAAIYCAVRVAMGYPKPIVLEASDHVGGALSMTNGATFFLNSRNRPGPLGQPGISTRGLNVLPGAPIQPSDISQDEFQRNCDIGFAIRMTLAMNAHVITNTRATTIGRAYGSRRAFVIGAFANNGIRADRVLLATGLGSELFPHATDKRIMSFGTFMKHMDQAFPLKGIKRVAVIGAGDAGKTTVEALTGQGPNDHWSIPSLDYVEKIEWWDANLLSISTCELWRQAARSRYKRIAGLLPKQDGFAARVEPRLQGAVYVEDGYDVAYVNDSAYDLVIDCRGYGGDAGISDYVSIPNMAFRSAGGRVVGRQFPNRELYRIGPCAQIDVRGTEPGFGIPENATALFRYADRTAALAASLS